MLENFKNLVYFPLKELNASEEFKKQLFSNHLINLDQTLKIKQMSQGYYQNNNIDLLSFKNIDAIHKDKNLVAVVSFCHYSLQCNIAVLFHAQGTKKNLFI